jgi:ubiquinone/menaquinone biosynthesis C-methylase UbiE
LPTMPSMLPVTTRLIATDLNPPILGVARKKFRSDEAIESSTPMRWLPFADASFDAVVCQFGLMFFTDEDKSYRERVAFWRPGAAMYSASGTASPTGMGAGSVAA